MFATELSYTNNFNYDHYLIKTRLIIIFVTFGIYTITHIIIICHCICNRQQNFFKTILFTLQNDDPLSAFAISWIFSSLYATLLYSLAYPIYVITLFTLHVTIFIVITIIFAFFVPGVISYWNKCTRVFLRFSFICSTSIGFVVLTVGISAIYVAVIYAYGSTIVERIFPPDGLVQALLLLPSIFVLLGAWLLQRKVFSKCSNNQSIDLLCTLHYSCRWC